MDATTVDPEEMAMTATAGWKTRASTRNAPPPAGGAVYGLGMIGALVYFVGSAESGREYALALGKAVVWPALLVYMAFKRLG